MLDRAHVAPFISCGVCGPYICKADGDEHAAPRIRKNNLIYLAEQFYGNCRHSRRTAERDIVRLVSESRPYALRFHYRIVFNRILAEGGSQDWRQFPNI